MIEQDPDQSNGTIEESSASQAMSQGKCPFLGIKSDPDTMFNYASIWNACYHSKPPEIPLLDYQTTTCLTPSYKNCSIYLSEEGKKFPPNLIEHVQLRSSKRKRMWIIGFALLILVVMVSLIISQLLTPKKLPEILVSQPLQETTWVVSQDTEEISTATKVEGDTPASIITLIETSSSSQVSSVTETIHKLDVPIGTEYQLIIHQVLEGESLEQYADQYNTSRETITRINYFLPVPLWVNWLVIIPVNLTEPGDLPTFEAYLVTDETITIGKLSEKLAVNPVDLSYYNGIGVDHVMKSGEWLLIPREGYMLYNP